LAKSKVAVKIKSYGIYDGWEREARELPKIRRFSEEVPARVGIEFGMIVELKSGKGKALEWCIDHPGILDDGGERREPFEGQERIKSANWQFFLGDTIWEPIDDKLGCWHLSVSIDGKVVAEKTFTIVPDDFSTPL
jgi:hypothetical protein